MFEELKLRLDRIEAVLASQRSKPLTLKEAAKYLDVSESYLYQLTSSGKIPHFKSAGGKRISFLESDLKAWLLAHRVMTQAEIDSQAANMVVNGKRKGASK